MSLIMHTEPNSSWIDEAELFSLLKFYHIRYLLSERFVRVLKLYAGTNYKGHRLSRVVSRKYGV